METISDNKQSHRISPTIMPWRIVAIVSLLQVFLACATRNSNLKRATLMKVISETETVIVGNELKLTVWDLTTMRPREQRARSLQLRDTDQMWKSTNTMHLFAGRQPGVFYTGAAMPYYFDMGTEIIGAGFDGGSSIGLVASFPLSPQIRKHAHDLDSLEQHWAANFNRAMWHRESLRAQHIYRRFFLRDVFEWQTDFIEMTTKGFWGHEGSSRLPHDELVVSKVSADGPWIRFDLYRPNRNLRGAVWLDIRNQRLVRAMDGDRQVFPVETRAPR